MKNMNTIINYDNLAFKSRVLEGHIQPISKIQGQSKENVKNVTPLRQYSQKKFIQYTSIENNNLNHSGIRQQVQVLIPVNNINITQQQLQRGISSDKLSVSPYSNNKGFDQQEIRNKQNQPPPYQQLETQQRKHSGTKHQVMKPLNSLHIAQQQMTRVISSDQLSLSPYSNSRGFESQRNDNKQIPHLPMETQSDKRLELSSQENQRLSQIIKNQMEENEKLKNEIKNINDRNSEKTREYVQNLEDKNQEINYLKNDIYQNQIQQKQLQETADKYKQTFEKIESKIYDVIQENDKLSEIIKQKDIYSENLQYNLNTYTDEYNKLKQLANHQELQDKYDNQSSKYQYEPTKKQNKIDQDEEFLQKYQNFEDLEQKTNQVIQENDRMVDALNEAKQTIEQQSQQYFELQKNMINMEQKQIKLIEILQQYKQLCQQIQEQANWGIEFEDEQI